jgi:hypothetical protein
MKDARTRQEIQDKALHRRTTPGHRKAKPKTKQECGDYNRRPTHDVHGEDEDWSRPYTDDSDSDDNESEYDEGDSENGDLYSGGDPSSKGGPVNNRKISPAMRCHISTATLCKGVPTFCRGCWMASHLVGSLITCSEGCVGSGLSLAWTAWLRLRCNAPPMKEGELAVCSSHSSEKLLVRG